MSQAKGMASRHRVRFYDACNRFDRANDWEGPGRGGVDPGRYEARVQQLRREVDDAWQAADAAGVDVADIAYRWGVYRPSDHDLPDDDLPGMWTRADFEGGDPDERSYAERDAAGPARHLLALCEAERLILFPGDIYVFEAVEGCDRCTELDRLAAEATPKTLPPAETPPDAPCGPPTSPPTPGYPLDGPVSAPDGPPDPTEES